MKRSLGHVLDELARARRSCYAAGVSVIIFGTRGYGTVEAHGGEHAETRFFHVWFAPLFPTGSVWITAAGEGFPIKLHPLSIAACYLRVWAVPFALGGLLLGVKGNTLGLLVGVIAAALVAWSWTWRSLRTGAARRRSDFNLVAFGTRCEAKRMPASMRDQVKRALDDAWSQRQPERTPDDVARHGTADAGEAALAYGLLRLAAVERRGADGRAADAGADRIVAGIHAPVDTVDGPYRATPPGATAPGAPSLDHLVALTAQQRGNDPISAATLRRQRRSSRLQLAGLILLTPTALGGLGAVNDALRSQLEVGIDELRKAPPISHLVRVACDEVSGPVWEEVDQRGTPNKRYAICTLGKYALPVRLDRDQAIPHKIVEGELREIPANAVWVRDGLRMDGAIYARSLDVYVDATTGATEKLILAVFGAALVLAAPALWVLWFRARSKRKAEELALAAWEAAPSHGR